MDDKLVQGRQVNEYSDLVIMELSEIDLIFQQVLRSEHQ